MMAKSRINGSTRLAGSMSLLALFVLCTCGFDGGCFGIGGSIPTYVKTQNTQYEDGLLVSAVPRPYQPLYGSWQYENVSDGPYQSIKQFGYNESINSGLLGQVAIANLRLNAYWIFGIAYQPGCPTIYSPNPVVEDALPTSYITATTDVLFECAQFLDGVVPPGHNIYWDSSVPPSTFAVPADVSLASYSASNLSAIVYDRNGNNVATLSAASIATGGMSANFAPPSLAPDIYAIAMIATVSGVPTYLGRQSIMIGSKITGLSHPFGVDGAYLSVNSLACPTGGSKPPPKSSCDSQNTQTNFPVISLIDSNQVSVIRQQKIAVGVHPTTVLTYGRFSSHTTTTGQNTTVTTTTTGTAYALVVNTGSSTVSIIDLSKNIVAATINVGNQPTAAAITADAASAYVVTYGGVVAKLNLSTMTVSGSAQIGGHLTSVTVAQPGSVIVGSNSNFLTLDANTLAQTASTSTAAGSVAVSFANSNQNVFASVVGSGGTGLIVDRFTSGLGGATSVNTLSDASAYGTSAVATYLPTPIFFANGVRSGVGAENFVVSVTPYGFNVSYGGSGVVMLDASIPGLPRAVGADPNAAAVYISSPDDNSVSVIPLPNLPSEDPNAIDGIVH